MRAKLRSAIADFDRVQVLFAIFAVILLSALTVGIIWREPLAALLPAGLLLLFWTVADFRKIWFLLLFFIPFSVEFDLPGGFGTDLPNEPLMVLLTPIYLVYVLQNAHQLKNNFIRHPLTLLVLLHLSWIIVTALFSTEPFISLKWTLAKIWYIVPFYFMTGSFIKTPADYRKLMWIIFLPLLFAVLLTIVRHGMEGFTFDGVNSVMKPFFRNHVNYAAILVIVFPMLWFFRYDFPKGSISRLFIGFGLLVLLLAVQLSFTRAAYVSLFLSVVAYFIIRFKLMKYAVGAVLIGLTVVLTFFINNNKFMEYTPDFDKTITHTKFDNLLEATAKGEDISTMERVYRWLGGYYMVVEKPLVGFGPGSFYEQYKGHTVLAFQTYVSDNPDKSTVHCYYLLAAAEQGIPGGIIFFLLVILTVLYGEKIYHQTLNPARKRIVMAMLLVFITIAALNIVNDLLEADKVGPFFFISIAVLVNADLGNQRRAASEEQRVLPKKK